MRFLQSGSIKAKGGGWVRLHPQAEMRSVSVCWADVACLGGGCCAAGCCCSFACLGASSLQDSYIICGCDHTPTQLTISFGSNPMEQNSQQSVSVTASLVGDPSSCCLLPVCSLSDSCSAGAHVIASRRSRVNRYLGFSQLLCLHPASHKCRRCGYSFTIP